MPKSKRNLHTHSGLVRYVSRFYARARRFSLTAIDMPDTLFCELTMWEPWMPSDQRGRSFGDA